MNEKKRAAYHEAGHIVVTAVVNPAAIGTATIFQLPDGRWTGDTPVTRKFVPQGDETWCAICTGGIIGEALGTARSIENRKDATVILTDEFVNLIDRCLADPRSGAEKGGWTLDVQMSDGTPTSGDFSLDDASELIQYGAPNQFLKSGVERAIQILNDKWIPLAYIAEALERSEELSLNNFLSWIVEKK